MFLKTLAFLLIATPAVADPTVTLTQHELETLIRGVCAQQAAAPAVQAALPIMQRVQGAFTPAAPTKTKSSNAP